MERVVNADEGGSNLLDKLQDAVGRGQNPSSVFPALSLDLEITTIPDPSTGAAGSEVFS